MLLLDRRAALGAGAVAFTVGAASVGLATPAFAAIPKVTVTPHKALTNNQVVSVSISNFPANTSVTIYECNNNGDGDLDNCKTNGAKKVKTDSKGKVTDVDLKVVTGPVGSTGSCGTSPGDKYCYVAAIASTQMQQTSIVFKVPHAA